MKNLKSLTVINVKSSYEAEITNYYIHPVENNLVKNTMYKVFKSISDIAVYLADEFKGTAIVDISEVTTFTTKEVDDVVKKESFGKVVSGLPVLNLENFQDMQVAYKDEKSGYRQIMPASECEYYLEGEELVEIKDIIRKGGVN